MFKLVPVVSLLVDRLPNRLSAYEYPLTAGFFVNGLVLAMLHSTDRRSRVISDLRLFIRLNRLVGTFTLY